LQQCFYTSNKKHCLDHLSFFHLQLSPKTKIEVQIQIKVLNKGSLLGTRPRQKGIGAYRYHFSPFLYGPLPPIQPQQNAIRPRQNANR
jgi:hypothetical protein